MLYMVAVENRYTYSSNWLEISFADLSSGRMRTVQVIVKEN